VVEEDGDDLEHALLGRRLERVGRVVDGGPRVGPGGEHAVAEGVEDARVRVAVAEREPGSVIDPRGEKVAVRGRGRGEHEEEEGRTARSP